MYSREQLTMDLAAEVAFRLTMSGQYPENPAYAKDLAEENVEEFEKLIDQFVDKLIYASS